MFVHLRLHTEFSVTDGIARIPEIVAAAAEDGQGALAITDRNAMFGAIKFYRAGRAAGVKPIIGLDLKVHDLPEGASGRVGLLASNRRGYLQLCELLSEGWLDGADQSGASVSWAALQRASDGLIMLSGAQEGPLGKALLRSDRGSEALARVMAQAFPERFYIELQRAGRADDDAHVAAACQLAADLGLPVVATHPVEFRRPQDYQAHEARVCIADGRILGDPTRPRDYTPQQYFKTSEEMRELFGDIPSAITNTVEIARRCNLTLELGVPRLPEFPIPAGQDMDGYFRQLARQGLDERMQLLYPDHEVRTQAMPRYTERLEMELDTILQMGFPGYFLIVSDFINWAKTHGCPVGPGRGSGAGSLVAYALKITDLDPLRYDLLFERFLNPERVSMPDFDVDFCQANRDRVIDYVKMRYGAQAVSQIATFGTMAARAAIRDVGRVLDMGYSFCDSISKLVPNKPGRPVTLQYPPEDVSDKEREKYAILAEPELARRIRNEEEVRTLIELAQKLEGITRNVGMHAGGVVIAPGKLTDFSPLYQQPGGQSLVTQYDKGDVEDAGLVKFDFLGLATLTILEMARQFIIARHPERSGFDFDHIPLDDAATYDLFQQGRTEAVFQFESRGMQAMLRDARPTRFEDLVALNAMYRPGPMENIPSFVARKRGTEPVSYPHPLVEPVLHETYGIMVYQEQVMQTAQILGGYSLGGADLLRRAMGKKKPAEMAKHRVIFREGAAKNGISEQAADDIFDLMEKFAGYGFNKSHAVAYSLLAYQTAWLKVHYPAEFFCANMTVEMGDTDKLRVLVDDARREGLEFLPPDINAGTYGFEPIGDQSIRYGLGAIKGTGQLAIEAIVAAREEGGTDGHPGPFSSFFDFARRIDRSRVNKRTVEALVQAGAFDGLNPNRAALLASVGLAFEYGAACEVNRDQGSLFAAVDDGYGSVLHEPDLEVLPAWDPHARLLAEKSVLGFFLSGHLFDIVKDEMRQLAPLPLSDVKPQRGAEPQLLAGMVTDFRLVNGRRGRLALFRLDDLSAVMDARADEVVWASCADILADDAVVIVLARAVDDRFSGTAQLMVQQVWSLAMARNHFGKYLRLELGTQEIDPSMLLGQAVADAPADAKDSGSRGLPLRLSLMRHATAAGAPAEFSGARVQLQLGESFSIFPSDQKLRDLSAMLGDGRVAVVYPWSA